MKTLINLSLSSYSKKFLKKSIAFITKFAGKKNNTKIHNKIRKKKVVTLLKSPHINKSAQEQFEIRYFARQIFIFTPKKLKYFMFLKKVLNNLFSHTKTKITILTSCNNDLNFINNKTLNFKHIKKNVKPTKLLKNKINVKNLISKKFENNIKKKFKFSPTFFKYVKSQHAKLHLQIFYENLIYQYNRKSFNKKKLIKKHKFFLNSYYQFIKTNIIKQFTISSQIHNTFLKLKLKKIKYKKSIIKKLKTSRVLLKNMDVYGELIKL